MHAREPLLLRKLTRKGLVRIRVFAREPLDRAPAREPPQLPAIARRLHERHAHDPVQRHFEERLDLLEAVVRAEDARVDAVGDVVLRSLRARPKVRASDTAYMQRECCMAAQSKAPRNRSAHAYFNIPSTFALVS